MQQLTLIFLLLIFKFYLSKSENVTLRLLNKEILGTKENTQNRNSIYYAFKGIRYGKAKRFEPSRPPKPWKGVYNATYDRATCIQYPKTTKRESEHCLFLSVYTPKIKNEDNNLLPVMFWIYGGIFILGDSLYSTYGPDYLLEENVVVVTINYRLGLFGFLSTGDENLPGNLGLKDLILGLQWVQDNIKFFGGNPDNVTIFGQSAGGALSSYLTISPLTKGKGYFKRAIIQSGSALATWSFQRKPRKIFNDIVKSTRCRLYSIAGTKAVLQCLKKLPSNQLRKSTALEIKVRSLLLLNIVNDLPFAPVIEAPSESAALTEETYKYLLNNNTDMVPIIIGVNNEEAIGFSALMHFKAVLIGLVKVSKKLVVPADMHIGSNNNASKASKIILDYYLNGTKLSRKTADEDIIRMISESYFVRQWRQYIEMLKDKTSVYCYVFTYNGTMAEKEPRPVLKNLGQVGHSEEISYLWRDEFSQSTTFDEHDYIVRRRVVRMWTNFAKFGNPTPIEDKLLENFTWRTSNYDETNNNCLGIGKNLYELKNFKEESYRMWRSLYDTYGNPLDTY